MAVKWGESFWIVPQTTNPIARLMLHQVLVRTLADEMDRRLAHNDLVGHTETRLNASVDLNCSFAEENR